MYDYKNCPIKKVLYFDIKGRIGLFEKIKKV